MSEHWRLTDTKVSSWLVLLWENWIPLKCNSLQHAKHCWTISVRNSLRGRLEVLFSQLLGVQGESPVPESNDFLDQVWISTDHGTVLSFMSEWCALFKKEVFLIWGQCRIAKSTGNKPSNFSWIQERFKLAHVSTFKSWLLTAYWNKNNILHTRCSVQWSCSNQAMCLCTSSLHADKLWLDNHNAVLQGFQGSKNDLVLKKHQRQSVLRAWDRSNGSTPLAWTSFVIHHPGDEHIDSTPAL